MKKPITKRLFIFQCLIFLFSIFIVQSCGPKEKDDIKPTPVNPKPDPEPEIEQKEFSYKISKDFNIEFSEYLKGIKVKDLQENDVTKHFGNRLTYIKPDSLYFKEDSLSVFSLNMPKQSYKIKWENDFLQIFDQKNNEWKNWAKRDPKDSVITINISFYKKTILNKERSNLSLGQVYGFMDKKDMLDSDAKNNSELIWMSRNYVFNLIKKK